MYSRKTGRSVAVKSFSKILIAPITLVNKITLSMNSPKVMCVGCEKKVYIDYVSEVPKVLTDLQVYTRIGKCKECGRKILY
jgi:DNA-directed RNA polymerase subunit RPC12/RpoP